MKNVVILGANNPQTLRLISDINQSTNEKINILGWIDNDQKKVGKYFFGIKVLGTPEILNTIDKSNLFLINNITRDGVTRQQTTITLLKFNIPFLNLIHPKINLTNVTIGTGVIIHEDVYIEENCEINDYCAISVKTSIAHESKIGRFSFLATNVTISGKVNIGEAVTIWTSATITPRLMIGNNVKIGAGSVVLNNIENDFTVYGNPARKLMNNNII
jgi:acetyltransferase EpsM